MSTRLFRTFTIVGLMVAATVSLAAHMAVAKSLPAANSTIGEPPTRIQVWFTQAPDPTLSRLELFGPSSPVKLKASQVGDDRSVAAEIDGAALADGRYRLRWQSAGDDGHVQRGEIAFTVARGN
jgi:methionine-rich copper-binding protein CopC